MRLVLYTLLNLILLSFVYAWEKLDYQIFDLNDELVSIQGKEASFYSALGVEKSATNMEITRAYRKLSLGLHPDKNPDPESNKLYTLLTSISAILKDEASRGTYDQHLRTGIPVWRGTGYYYNRYKPGPVVVGMFLCVAVCIAQYLSAWALYYSKYFQMKQLQSDVNNMSYSQLKKHLKKSNSSNEKLNKKDFKSSDNIALIKKIGNVDLSGADELVKPALSDVFIVQLPMLLWGKIFASAKENNKDD